MSNVIGDLRVRQDQERLVAQTGDDCFGHVFGFDHSVGHDIGDGRIVAVGHGRDYDDVAPVRGVYVGGVSPQVDATVEMRRMEPVERVLGDRPRRRVQPVAVEMWATEAEAAEQQQQ